MPISRSAPRLQPSRLASASRELAAVEVAWASPAASSSQPIGFFGRCQASSAPQPANASPIAPLVTVKLLVASAKDMRAASANPMAPASSAIASQNRAAATTRLLRWPVSGSAVMDQ